MPSLDNKTIALMEAAIDYFIEYVERHEFSADLAKAAAITEVIEVETADEECPQGASVRQGPAGIIPGR